jgi:hypothetical protein
VDIARAREAAASRQVADAQQKLESLRQEAQLAREDARVARDAAHAAMTTAREVVQVLAKFYADIKRTPAPTRPSLLDEIFGPLPSEEVGEPTGSALTAEYLAALKSTDDD